MPDCVGSRVGFAMRADLAVDVRDVPRNGADAKHKFTGDFGIGAAGGDQAEDLDLPSREGRDKAGFRRPSSSRSSSRQWTSCMP